MHIHALKRGGGGDGGDQPVRPFNRQIGISGQRLRPDQKARVDAKRVNFGSKCHACRVMTDGSDQRRAVALLRQHARNIQRHAAGGLMYLARHVITKRDLRGAMADYVPMGRAYAQDVWTVCHLHVVPQSSAIGKRTGGARSTLLRIGMFEDLSERLFAHFVAGRWRAPFGNTVFPVLSHAGIALGQVVSAGPPDVARAVQALRAADDHACRRLADALTQEADALAQAIALQTGRAPSSDQLAQMIGAVASPRAARGGIVFSSTESDPLHFGQALGAGVRAGMIWCPHADQAVFATALTCIMQDVDIPPGAFAMLHTRVPETETALRATSLFVHEG